MDCGEVPEELTVTRPALALSGHVSPYFVPSKDANCEVLRSPCLYVYLSQCFVCLCAYISEKPHVQKHYKLTKFSVHVTCGRGSVLLWQCNTSCTTGFIHDIMFPHNGANGPEAKTTHVSASSASGGTSGEVCHCRLYLFSGFGNLPYVCLRMQDYISEEI